MEREFHREDFGCWGKDRERIVAGKRLRDLGRSPNLSTMSNRPVSSSDKSNDKMSEAPPMCKAACGFFAGVDYDGYCSLCFKVRVNCL